MSQMTIKEKKQLQKSSLEKLNSNHKTKESWIPLPCEGIYKLTSSKENINFSYCTADYWNCPNKTCIMNLV